LPLINIIYLFSGSQTGDGNIPVVIPVNVSVSADGGVTDTNLTASAETPLS
jgi:hypothetical protein